MTLLEPRHEQRLLARFGDGVRPWLLGLDARVEAAAAHFRVVPDPGPALGGSTSVVVPCDRGVLKLSPSDQLADQEATALAAWSAASHVVTLLGRAGPALLLERLRPGEPAPAGGRSTTLPLLGELWTLPAPELDLPSLADRVAFLGDLTVRRARGQERVGPGIVAAATARLAELAADPGRHGLVHGDLHGGNVLLDAVRGPVAIDPRPCLGDRTFDLVDVVLRGARRPRDVAEGVEAVADALPGLDTDRLRAWVEASLPCDAASAAAVDPHSEEASRLIGLLPP